MIHFIANESFTSFLRATFPLASVLIDFINLNHNSPIRPFTQLTSDKQVHIASVRVGRRDEVNDTTSHILIDLYHFVSSSK